MTDESQSAADYDDRTSAAVRSVLVEIVQTLGSFCGKFAVIGGAVPWLLDHQSGRDGFAHIVAKFKDPDGYGATCVRKFVEGSDILDGRTAEEWQQDAFGQVNAWARAIGLR